jgi:hypothetical protein
VVTSCCFDRVGSVPMLQQEAAGTVGVLRHARLQAHLAEQRRLLVAGDAGNRDLLDAEHARHLAVHLARQPHLRQHARRNIEQAQQLLVPLHRVDVEEHRPRRVADVGDVALVRGELPEQPGIYGPERELAGRGAGARAGHVVENPADLAGGKIRVDEQAGPGLNRLAGAVGFQPFAEIGGAAVLPDDRVVHRFAGLPVPDNRRLALVGDADRGDVARPDLRAAERLDRDADLRRPDLLRIVLDPAGLREQLRELFLRDRANRAVAVEDDGPRAGRSLVEREDERHGGSLYNGRRERKGRKDRKENNDRDTEAPRTTGRGERRVRGAR